MIKVKIIYLDIVLTFSSGKTVESIEIESGIYRDESYHSLIICDNKVFLEGDDIILLKKDFDILKIHIKSNIEKVATYLNRESIYIDGINAITEDEKEDVLKLLLTKKYN